ncbi:MAG TPA: MFS transporter [Gaiellales bacterium]|nr:MFS transporter [Gaiellales bacterium]
MSESVATAGPAAKAVAAGSGFVLLTLAAGQFVMTLDSSVMNVSIATVAKDVGTTVTGIQTAITAYTLVMAALMIVGGKIGGIIGRKRAFSIGCVIYAAGSFITSISQNLAMLMFGWSFLEGVGAALILPAIVALVAGNFPQERRPAAYGMVAAAGASAIAVGPLIGGAATTFWTWRIVFVGEVIVVAGILVMTRRMNDAPPGARPRLDLVGAVLSALGLSLMVFAVLKAGTWGWIAPKADAPTWLHMSPVVWLFLAGIAVMLLFRLWEERMEEAGREPLVTPGLLKNRQLSGGLIMFFFQYLVQMGVFFTVPLYLSIALGLSALETGARLLPLSLTLLAAALGIPRLLPTVSPRRVVQAGILLLLAGTLVLLGGLTPSSGPEVVFVPLLLIGLGIGALASQLGAVTVSALPDERSPEVGGVQNAVTNLGASFGTAVAGSILIAAMTTAFLTHIDNNPAVRDEVAQKANVELASGIPFLSDADLTSALKDAGLTQQETQAALDANAQARITGLRAALAVLAALALVSLFFTGRIPSRPIGSEAEPAP